MNIIKLHRTKAPKFAVNRRVLLSTALSFGSAALISASMAISARPASSAGLSVVAVHEITIVAPDIVCVEVRDPAVRRGAFVELRSVDAGPQDTWVQRVNTTLEGVLDYCQVVGVNKNYLRFQDIPARVYYNRSAGDVAPNYGPIGGRYVTNVYRKSD